jgi:hypothetical protein
MTTIKKTNNFVEVEVRPQEPEEGDYNPEESTFYFKCNKCHLPAQATNGHLILTDPKDPMGDPKGFEVDYLFCHRCDILEDMKDVEFNTQIFYVESKEAAPADKSMFTRKIRDKLFIS